MGGKALVVKLEGTPKTLVETKDLNSKTTTSAAVQKASEFVKKLKTATPNKSVQIHSDMWSLAADIHGAASFRLGSAARDKFLFAISKPFGGMSAYSGIALGQVVKFFGGADTEAMTISSSEDLASIKWINTLAGGPKGYDSWWEPDGRVVVAPLCLPWVNSGFLYTFTMQAMTEKGTSEGTENYADVYVSSEVGAKIPIIESIISVDLRMGRKTGSKSYKKIETKNAVRTGPQVSKSFILQDVGRNCAYFGTKVGADALRIQSGYQIVPREGGDTVGPMWSHICLDGSEVANSALEAATAKLRELMEEAAVDVAKQFAAM